jgi:hypothetical protein
MPLYIKAMCVDAACSRVSADVGADTRTRSRQPSTQSGPLDGAKVDMSLGKCSHFDGYSNRHRTQLFCGTCQGAYCQQLW